MEQLTDPTFVNARPTLCSKSNFADCISLLLNTPAQKWVLPCTEAAVCTAHETQCPQTQLPHAEQYFQHSWQHLRLRWSESSSTVIKWMHKNVNFLNRWHSTVFYSLIYQRIIQPLKMNTTDFSWGKGGRCGRLTTYHPRSAERQENSGP